MGLLTVECAILERYDIDLAAFVGNKMLKSFPLPVIKFPLPEYFLTASEEMFPLLSQRDAPAEEVCTAEKLKIHILGTTSGIRAKRKGLRQATSDKEKELWVKLKRLFKPDVEDQLWTHTQALMHDPVEWKLYDTCGVHHVLTRDQEIFMLVEKDYPLRKGLAIVMISNKLQGRIFRNKMLKSFPLPVMKFPLPEYFPTASEEMFPLLSQRDTPAEEVCTAEKLKRDTPAEEVCTAEKLKQGLVLPKTFDLVWIWLGGDYGNLFLMGYNGIQWYALTINPTVYVSHIRQFWSTSRIETTDTETKILSTVDGKPKTTSESSIRRNLKLNDDAGISSLPDAKLFENLALMGYNIFPNQKFTFQKGQFSHQWKYLIHTIMQCLSPKSTGFNEFSSNIATAVGEGSGTLTELHHTPSPEAQQSPHTAPPSPSLLPATTEIPTLRQYSRRARIAQSLALPTTADEPASLSRDDSQGEAFLTVSGLEAGHDKENIIKTSALTHDSPPRVTSLDAGKGNKDEGGAKPSGEDATIKGRSLETGEEAGVEKITERGSNGTKELVNVLTSLDAANILTSRVQVVSVLSAAEVSTVGIPTGSGLVSTASPIFTTASVVTPYSRRKGKDKMVESYTPKKKKLQEQIDVHVAREMDEQMVREDQR
nr:hypothetical protein [Tanacetum cinerariifolium]